MAKLFPSTTEQETILRAYSTNFDKEFFKVSPFKFCTTYNYTISICPEENENGEKTGRVLVNHFNQSSQVPVFIDVWERKGNELQFHSRNIPGKDLISADERIKVLEEELEKLTAENIALSEQLSTLTNPVHNARGAGRKKSKKAEKNKEKVLELVKEGLTRVEICERIGIGKSTYYRYIQERKKEGKVKG